MPLFVVVLPNGFEYHAEQDPKDILFSYRRMCEAAVSKAGLTTPRKSLDAVTCAVCQLVLRDGKLTRVFINHFAVHPPLERLKDDEFEQEMRALLSDLPDEFQSFIREQAYDRGHSAGMEEVLSIAQDLHHNLKECVDKYTSRITSELYERTN